MRRLRPTAGIALCLVGGLFATACGSSSDSSTSATTASSGAATNGGASTTAPAASDTVATALKYVGGKAGKADASLAPVTVGYLNQEGTTPSFPEMSAAANAAVTMINDQLGGIQGHPLKLDSCILQTEEDGQKCAAQLLSDKVPIANIGLSEAGNGTFYKTVNGAFPTVVSVTSSSPDNVTPDVYSFNGGASAILYAMAYDAKLLGATSVASIGSGNPGGRYAGDKVLIPKLKQLGIPVKNVYYDDAVTTPGILSALQAAGVSKAGAVLLDPSSPAQCLSVYTSLKQLGLKIPVITTPICNADAFVKATGAGPEGWNIFSYVTNPRIEDDPQVAVYRDAMTSAGKGDDITVGFASQQFAATMTIAKMANAIGPDNLTPATYTAAIKALRGPVFTTPGVMRCGQNLTPEALTSCGNAVAKSTFEDGAWKAAPAVVDPEVKFGTK